MLLPVAAALHVMLLLSHVREKLARNGSDQYLLSVLAERSF